MKKVLIIIAIMAFISSCKQKEEPKTADSKISIGEKIANAHGLEHWDKVTELQFTFNVDTDSTHVERSWSWRPKTNEVMMVSKNDTVSFYHNAVDSLSKTADKAFINDKYWLLAPFQLVWDTSATISGPTEVLAPISNSQLNKITLTYPDEGGYTPGDAYDFYYDDNFIIKEWSYRKGNVKNPTITTTWEDYENFNGIKISKTHKRPNENWMLYFTNLKMVHK